MSCWACKIGIWALAAIIIAGGINFIAIGAGFTAAGSLATFLGTGVGKLTAFIAGIFGLGIGAFTKRLCCEFGITACCE